MRKGRGHVRRCRPVCFLFALLPSHTPLSHSCYSPTRRSCAATFDCRCTCDVTAFACDADCCCDADCTAFERSSAAAKGACAPEGPVSNTIRGCFPTTAVVKVNPHRMMTAEPALNDLTCVAVNNNPSKGNFIRAPGAQPASAFASASLWPRYSFVQTLDPATDRGIAETDPIAASVYSIGDTIPAGSTKALHCGSDTTLPQGCKASAAGVFALPSAGPGGACADQAPVRFLRGTRGSEGFGLPAPSVCSRLIQPSLPNGCDALDPKRLEALLLGKLPSANVDSATTSFTPIATSAVWRRDLATGAMTKLVGALPAMQRSDNGPCGCADALVEAEIVVTHDGAGAIQSVAAELVVAYVNSSSFVDPSGVMVCNDASVETKWGVQFVKNTTSTAERRHKSGNPGYNIGAPLLVANISTNVTDAVDARRSGLVLWGSGDEGQCDGSDAPVGVGFMADMAASCTKTVNLAELKTLCDAASTLDGTANSADVNINASHAMYVGVWGNADPLQRATDWLEVTRTFPTTQAAWVAKSRSCTGLVTSMHYEVLVAQAGEGGNPQRKVVAMNVRFGTENVAFRMGGQTDRQQLVFTSTVTFIAWEGASATAATAPLVLGVRPLLPAMPADLFYPFTSTSREIDLTQNTDWGVVVLLVLIAAVVVVIVVYVFSRLRMAQMFIWFCALSLACIAVVLFTASISVINAAAESV